MPERRRCPGRGQTGAAQVAVPPPMGSPALRPPLPSQQHKPASVQPLHTLTTGHCPHSPAARRCCSNRSISPACLGPQQLTCSSAFAAVGPCWDRQTDGRTPYRCVDPAPHAMQAVPASISCGRWTRATRGFMLYTELDASLCD